MAPGPIVVELRAPPHDQEDARAPDHDHDDGSSTVSLEDDPSAEPEPEHDDTDTATTTTTTPAHHHQAAPVPSDSSVLTALVRGGFLGPTDLQRLASTCRRWRRILRAIVGARRSLVVTHAACARHRVPRRSERPERLEQVLGRVRRRFPGVPVLETFASPTPAQLGRFHSEIHVDTLTRLGAKIERSMAALDALPPSPRAATSPRSSASSAGPTVASSFYRARPTTSKSRAAYYAQFEYMDLDEDTVMMRHTLEAALTAAGGVCAAIDRVLLPRRPVTASRKPRAAFNDLEDASDAAELGNDDRDDQDDDDEDDAGPPRNAFCVVRPPGHHAEPQRAMGFCFLNNIGIGAFHALDAHGLGRVAIVDFDVHHGNGTQRRVEREPRLLYVSLHQAPLYPHTGAAEDHGPLGNILNIPLPARTPGSVYRRRLREQVWPRLRAHAPELVLLSAGFDGHALDPLSDMRLTAEDFYELTRELVAMAWATPARGRVVSVLEGGYHPRALADSAEQHLLALVHGSIRGSHAPVGWLGPPAKSTAKAAS